MTGSRRPTRRSAAATPLLVALATLALVTPPGAAQDAGPEPATRQDSVDVLLADYSGPDTPGALVAVVRGGEIVFERAYGMANLTHQVPYTTGTPTNIGSTSKQFTAFAIALLAARGRLGMDDDVRDHVPELPDFGETVTLRHLMTHTGGYREFLNALAIGGWRLENADYIDRDEIIEVVRRQPALQNSPGAEWNYNNTGYALLATVVERVTGEAFPDWMRANVFEPLGMTSTWVRPTPGHIVPGSAQGYAPLGEDGFREVTDLSAAMGAGGMYTTLGDLARWMRNLRTGELGGTATIEAITTPYVLTTGDTTNYGLGLMIQRSRGLRVIQHGGADAAHRSTFIYYPELDAGLIVQSNHAGFDGRVPSRIAELFFGEHMEPRAEPATPEPVAFDPAAYDPARFDIFVGRYELEAQAGFILTFRRDGERLLARATGQPEFRITPTSDSTFAVDVVEASLTFHRDGDGRVTGLTLHQNGDHAARRLPDEDVERLDLAAYTGRYYAAEFETYYRVELEDDQLVVRHRRRPPATLEHRRDDEFAGSFPLATVRFERDDAGLITGFRASNVRARDILFERVR